VVTATAAANSIEQLSVHVYDAEHPIQNRGELEIYHPSELLLGRYEASNVSKVENAIVDGVFGLTDSISGVTDNSVGGSGAVFTVGKTVDRDYVVYGITGTGTGYLTSETIVIDGTLFGGASSTNDATITISQVSDSGVVQAVTIAGTPATSDTTPRYTGEIIKVILQQVRLDSVKMDYLVH